MADALRRSIRKKKNKQDSDFEYDNEVLDALCRINVLDPDMWQQRPAPSGQETSLANTLPSDICEVNYVSKSVIELPEFELVNNTQ